MNLRRWIQRHSYEGRLKLRVQFITEYKFHICKEVTNTKKKSKYNSQGVCNKHMANTTYKIQQQFKLHYINHWSTVRCNQYSSNMTPNATSNDPSKTAVIIIESVDLYKKQQLTILFIIIRWRSSYNDFTSTYMLMHIQSYAIMIQQASEQHQQVLSNTLSPHSLV